MDAILRIGEEMNKAFDQRNSIILKKLECVDRLKELYFESKNCPVKKIQENWAVADYYWREYEKLEAERILFNDEGQKLFADLKDSYNRWQKESDAKIVEINRKYETAINQ